MSRCPFSARRFPARRCGATVAVSAALVVLSLASAPYDAARAEDRTPLYEVDGQTIYVEDVEGALAFRIYKHELDIYSLLRAEAERQIEDKLLEAEAKRRGTSVEALLEAVLAGPDGDKENPAASEAAIDAYLAENPADPRRNPAQARERVRHYLIERERIARRVAFLDGLREAAGARLLLDPPPRPRTRFVLEDAPVRGPAGAPIEIVHFASFGSRNGSRSAAKLARLADAFPGQIRRAHIHLLGDRDEAGLQAARLAKWVAANDPERFWPLHDALFERSGKLDASTIDSVASTLGVSRQAIEAAANDPRWLGAVKSDIDRAVAAGVPREPGLFLNGLFVSGLLPYEDLVELVRSELPESDDRKASH